MPFRAYRIGAPTQQFPRATVDQGSATAIVEPPKFALTPRFLLPAAARRAIFTMSSTGVNVFRWSALAFGVFYGFSHQRTITTTQRAQHAQHEYEQKQKLIDQAKAEYAKKKNPSVASADGVVTDINSPEFDLEKFLLKIAKDSP
ncbi:uncharacterized protein TrAFT101_003939 [Trichoderma asperellum]|uniref:uncharacterized protein n=1 Tax=Trichoderma asperellum TaxID=101201 RepID=UPI0033215B9D|nr:hypothetical protein TrAFT101_003939 [Trichoderma asperellum]